jgi:uncharacterized protein (TIGR03437 family)
MKTRGLSGGIVAAALLLLLSTAASVPASAQGRISITNSPPPGTVGIGYSFQFTASPTGNYNWTWTCGADCTDPVPGLTLSTSGGISGTPTTVGSYTIYVTASDAAGDTSGPVPLSVQIGELPLTINTTSLQDATRGTNYNVLLSATGGTGGYSWSLSAGALPSPLVVNAAGSISGTPSATNAVGPYLFTVKVMDSSSNVAFARLTLTLRYPVIVLTPASLPAGGLGANYSSGVSVQSGTGSGGTYGYSWTGNPPPGLGINGATGAIAGTPTSAGTYNFTINVSDMGQFTNPFPGQNYTITIYPAITLSPIILPPADALSNYTQTFTALGGTGLGFTFSITGTPPGMSFNTATGVLSGPPAAGGPYAFTITVHDSLGLSVSVNFTLTVNPPLTLTPATLKSGQTGTPYSVVFIGAGGSGTYSSYTFTGNAIPGLNFSGSTLSGTPTQAGNYQFTVTVKDSLGYTATNPYTLSIGSPVTVTPGTIPSGQVGVTYGQVFTASGGNGGPYTWSVSPNNPFGLSLTPAPQTATLGGSPTSSGTAQITVTATDSTGASGSATDTLTIAPATLTLTPSTLPNGTVGTAYSQVFTANGGLGTYTYSIVGTQPPGLALTPNNTPTTGSATFGGNPTTGGSYSFSIQVSDGSKTASQSFVVTISNPPITLTPTTGALPAGIVNGNYTQAFVASGGSGTGYTFTIAGSTPGLTLNASTGVLSGAPTSATTYSFTIGVSDGSQFTPPFQAKSYTIVVEPAITITPTTIPAADSGVNYTQSFTASGGSGSGYTYSISAQPPGLSFNAANGTLSGPPSSSGSFPFTITARDSAGLSGTSPTITLTVNPPLTLSPSTLTAGQVGTGYSQAFTASGGSGGYTYSLGGAQPPGLSLTANVLSGSPTANGTYNFTITAKDTLGGSVTNSYSLTIGNAPIVVQPTVIPSGQIGVNYSQAFTATGGNGSYTFTISPQIPPFGLTFNSGTLSGTPTSTGTTNIAISATDGTLTGQRNYTLTILPAGLTLSPSTAGNGIVGVKYSQTFTASNGASSNYTFTLSPGPPAGLQFTTSGATATLSGTPTASGSFPITVQVSDGVTSISRNYTVAISSSALSILTTSLPSGTVNQPYATSLAASGGTPPYTWAVPGNNLPGGLTLTASGPGSGAISGGPTSAGNYSFAVTVTDSVGSTASTTLSITVQAAALSFTTTSPLPPALSGAKYSVTFGATGGVPPYTFTLNSGPMGLGLSGATLSGTLTNNGAAPITYNISMKVNDSGGNSAGAGFTVTVQPAAVGIILSAGSLAFTAVSSGPTPPPQYVSASSTTLATAAFSVSSDSTWLSASPGGGNTPATLQVNVNQSGLKPGPYNGNITVTGPDGPHGVAVTLTVNAQPPQLSVAPTIVTFQTDGTTQPGAGGIQVSNLGDGTIHFTASVLNGSSWVNLGSYSTAVTASTPSSIPINAIISGLAVGDYRDVVHIDSDAGSADVPVTLLVAGGSTINLVPAGSLLSSRLGQGTSEGTQSFEILTTGTAAVNWTATQLGGSGWLTLNTTSGTSAAGNPGEVSYTVDPSNLATGDYYARIHIDAPTATNTPVEFVVVSTVAPISTPAVPDPSPAGLLFVSSPGSLVPPAQSVSVNTSSIAQIAFSAAANTFTGGNWLSVSPTSGFSSSGTPGNVSVTVNAAGLATGVYQGGVSVTLQGNPTGVRTVNVILIVTGSAQSPTFISRVRSAHGEVTPDAAGCTPSKLVALQTGLVSNFSTPAGWPTPLAIQLANDCGGAVTNASVVANFSNGDAPLALPISDNKNAVYSATWNPHGAGAQVTVTAQATAPNLKAATTQIIGTVSPNKVPILFAHGTIHNLNPQPGAALAPGTIVQIYGSGLAPAAMQTNLPLPTNVSGTTVIIGGIEAPLYYVSDGQLNAELPLQLNASHQYQILVSANGALTLPDTLDIEPVTPGVAALQNGAVIAQHADTSYVTATSPAQPGEILTIYLAGMGLTDVAVQTGQVGPSDPLAHPTVAPAVTVNGEQAQISFAGLTPQAVGLYQINFTVPSDAPPGNLQLVVTQANAQSNVSTLIVQ